MFLLRSHQPQPPGPTLNALSAPDRTARRTRHLATCEELAELGMDLARAAHREALRDMQPPAAPRTPVPALTYASAPPPPREAIFGQLFAVISRSVRQTMLLEDRLATGATDHPPPESAPRSSHPSPTPPARPAPDGTRIHADRLTREALEDECLHADTRPARDILAAIRSELAAAASGLPPRQTPEPTPHPRRPIPIIPPGPEPSLTALGRAALLHHQTHPPKPPD